MKATITKLSFVVLVIIINNFDTYSQNYLAVEPDPPKKTGAFGSSLAASLDFHNIFIGTPGGYTRSFLNETGVVFEYEFIEAENRIEKKSIIYSNNTRDQDKFGTSVVTSANGELVAVGAIGDDTKGKSSGCVYIFTRKRKGWKEVVKLTRESQKDNSYFGSSLALNESGDLLAVGAPSGNNIIGVQGEVYIYQRLNDQWTYRETLTSPNSSSENLFGYSLDFDETGNTLVVGAPNDNNEGRIYIFNKESDRYILKYTGKEEGSSAFGKAVAISTDSKTVFVTSDRFAMSFILGTGANVEWNIGDKFVPSIEGYHFGRFGQSLDISKDGSIVAIGCPSGGKKNGLKSGAVLIIGFNDNKWKPLEVLLRDNSSNFGRNGGNKGLGFSVIIDSEGGTVASGKPNNFGGAGYSTGTMHIYKLEKNGIK